MHLINLFCYRILKLTFQQGIGGGAIRFGINLKSLSDFEYVLYLKGVNENVCGSKGHKNPRVNVIGQGSDDVGTSPRLIYGMALDSQET